MVTSQSAPVLPVAASQNSNLSFLNNLPMSGTMPNLNGLIFTHPNAANDLLQRVAASVELDRAMGATGRRSLSFRDLVDTPAARQGLGTLPNFAAAQPPASSILASLQSASNLRRSFTAPEPAPAPAIDIQSALVISQLQRENQELAQRLQAEQDSQRRRQDPK